MPKTDHQQLACDLDELMESRDELRTSLAERAAKSMSAAERAEILRAVELIDAERAQLEMLIGSLRGRPRWRH